MQEEVERCHENLLAAASTLIADTDCSLVPLLVCVFKL